MNRDSTVETFVALRLSINSWRWKDVPFYIRAGKRLATTATEVVVMLRQAPAVFTDAPPPSNYFRFQVTPAQTIAIASFVKVPGEVLSGHSVELTVSQHTDPTEMSAYEELLTDAIRGVTARFARQDYVEEAWRIVDPVLNDATPVYEYDPASWGPCRSRQRGRARRRLGQPNRRLTSHACFNLLFRRPCIWGCPFVRGAAL